MKPLTIQTLHIDLNKTNKKIDLEKYLFVKEHLLAILENQELTHTELMKALYVSIKDEFDGGIQWYGEIVKLDLEARGLIERTKAKLPQYRLK